jgi:hypothetical protein
MTSASMALVIRVPGFILAPPSRHATPAPEAQGREPIGAHMEISV